MTYLNLPRSFLSISVMVVLSLYVPAFSQATPLLLLDAPMPHEVPEFAPRDSDPPTPSPEPDSPLETGLITSRHYRFLLTGDSTPNRGHHVLDVTTVFYPVAALAGFEYVNCSDTIDVPMVMEIVGGRDQAYWYFVHKTEGERKCDELRVVIVFFHDSLVGDWSRPLATFAEPSKNMERMTW